jgi:hypothetical protein
MAKNAKKGRAETATTGATGDRVEAAPPPGTVIPPKTVPKLRAEAAVGPGQPATLGPDPVAATVNRALDVVRASWRAIVAAVLVLVVVILFASWHADSARARNRLAWQEFRKAGDKASAEDLQRLLEQSQGTQAEPFILLRLGDANLAKGDAASANVALATYQRVLHDFGSNELAASLAKADVDAATQRLAFDPAKQKGEKVEWAKGVEPAGVTPTGAGK